MEWKRTTGGTLLFFGKGNLLVGKSSSKPHESSVASNKHVALYTRNSAITGTSVGMYNKHEVSGVAGSGVALFSKAYSNVASALLVGAQILAEFGAAGKVSGLTVGCRSQVLFADDNTVTPTGTIAGGQSELYFSGDNSSTTDVSGAMCSIHRFILDGDTTARAKVPYLFEIVNIPTGTDDATKMLNTAHLTASHCLRVRINGADYGLLLDAY